MDTILDRCREIDRMIKDAQWSQANQQFQFFENKKWPRKYLVELCHLARRLNKPLQILLWMHPIVRSEKILADPATAQEIALYTIGLTRIGAFREAEVLLKSSPEKTADTYLAHYQLNSHQWKYAETVRPLKNYMKQIERGSYAFKIAELNLLAAMVVKEDWIVVDDLQGRLLSLEYSAHLPLLRANVLETYAQSLIYRERYSEAREILEQASEILKNSSSWYELFIAKWKLFLNLRENKKIDLEAAADLREKAHKSSNFETLRELDFHQSLVTGDQELFLKVYHGTRFASYKKRMKSLFKQSVSTRQKTGILLGPNDVNHKPGSFQGNEISGQCLKMLKILFTDHYRPLQIGELFRDLYPDEYFNPHSSAPRLYQVYRRLKDELIRLEAPLRVNWIQNQIRWQAERPFVFEFRNKDSQTDLPLRRLPDLFTLQELETCLKIPRRSAQRKLSQWVSKGVLRRTKLGTYKKCGGGTSAA